MHLHHNTIRYRLKKI
ncbi:hypothetical protein AB8U03_16320 [Clostridium sp. Mt-5]